MKKLNVVFMGTPDFSVPALEILFQHPQVNLHSVVTMPDRKAGRGGKLASPPVAEFAKLNKLKLIQTENINKEDDYLQELEDSKIDCIVVLAFAQFLGSKVLNLPAHGCFNIHTSLLPKYRGAAPIQYALLNDDEITGVSIQKMVKKMDAGDLVLSDKITISPTETGGQLFTRLKFQAALSLNHFVTMILSNDLTFTKQDESLVSFAPTLQREDGHIKFKQSTRAQIINKKRAFTPWPGIYCNLNKKRLKILELDKSEISAGPGEIKFHKNNIIVGCQDGSLRLSYIQLEGKKACSDSDLINGFKEEPSLGE